jgi:hypothetical protein
MVVLDYRLPIGNPVAALGGSGRRESHEIYDLRYMISAEPRFTTGLANRKSSNHKS